MQSTPGIRSLSVRDLTFIAMMTALIAVCAWITVPMTVPFTMQTFGVFMALLVLGGPKGTIAIALYILLGMAGVPVFAGFGAGVGVLAGPTGGYIVGFLLTGILYWGLSRILKNLKVKAAVLAAGLCLCYLFGTIWFSIVMNGRNNPVGFFQAIGLCVLPYVLPDLLKLLLALQLSERLKKAGVIGRS